MIQASIKDGLDTASAGMKTYAGNPSVDAYVGTRLSGCPATHSCLLLQPLTPACMALLLLHASVAVTQSSLLSELPNTRVT